MTRFQWWVSSITTTTLMLICVAGQAQGVDRIKRRNGTVSGKITKVSQLAVTISRGGVEREVPVEEITSIAFAGEPKELRSARLAASGGRYPDALKSLKKISRTELNRTAIKQELDFQLARCVAKLAIAGQGNLESATAEVAKFLTQNRNSFHLTEAIELSGDLQLAASNYDAARKHYTKLGRAPSAFHKARSALLIGRSLQEQGQHVEALAEFDKALAAAAGSTTAESQQLETTLLAAVSRAAGGDLEQSTEAVKKIITEAEPDNTELMARAYNALGDCYLTSSNPKAARDAFLHVDLLFASASTNHAKALYELSRLWSTLGHESRALDARQRLREEYPASPWAKR